MSLGMTWGVGDSRPQWNSGGNGEAIEHKISAVEHPHASLGAVKSARELCEHQDDVQPINTQEVVLEEPLEPTRVKVIDDASVKFADEIKIDFIASIDFRIMCRFLGTGAVNDIKNMRFGPAVLERFERRSSGA